MPDSTAQPSHRSQSAHAQTVTRRYDPQSPVARARRPVLVLFFSALALCGAMTVNFAVNDFHRGMTSATWPTVKATVMKEGIEGAMALRHASYRYYAQGALFEGNRVRVFTNNRLFSPAAPISVEAGEILSIRVNPANPAQSLVVPGASGFGFMIMIVLGGLLFFLGFGAALRTLREE